VSVYLDDGDVTLHLGDCREVMPLLEPVDAVVTDPPYGVTSLGWDVPVRAWIDLLPLKPSGSVWIFGSMRSLLDLDIPRGWTVAEDIVWEKHNGSGSAADRFRRVHEHAVRLYRGRWSDVYSVPPTTADARRRTVRRKERPPHWGEIAGSTYASEDCGSRLMRSVIQVRSMHGSAVHPTQKPTGILRPLIEESCPPGGVVLDPFAGSGSTLLAARECGRRGVGIEIDPEYAALLEPRLAQISLLGGAA